MINNTLRSTLVTSVALFGAINLMPTTASATGIQDSVTCAAGVDGPFIDLVWTSTSAPGGPATVTYTASTRASDMAPSVPLECFDDDTLFWDGGWDVGRECENADSTWAMHFEPGGLPTVVYGGWIWLLSDYFSIYLDPIVYDCTGLYDNVGGLGDACGSRGLPMTCADDLECKDTVLNGMTFDAPGVCVDSEFGCSNDEMAELQCDGLIHPAVVGGWTCPDHTCVWSAEGAI